MFNVTPCCVGRFSYQILICKRMFSLNTETETLRFSPITQLFWFLFFMCCCKVCLSSTNFIQLSLGTNIWLWFSLLMRTPSSWNCITIFIIDVDCLTTKHQVINFFSVQTSFRLDLVSFCSLSCDWSIYLDYVWFRSALVVLTFYFYFSKVYSHTVSCKRS